ncbi:membrane protein [Stenotrophomonas humi]|uniref:Membrane protein n=1 Tax=Stenotrophomonas humi TaxID=405444 RepID=A0A0R0C8Y5_9GAMM|nr:DUF6713 family protein [Stenotrophomonas humi]KRG61827.1 membrane protein [Stenotrophomonas humi]
MDRWYTATLLSLIIHQIDAAYWHEWDMFRVPGGIQGFLVFNAVAVGLLLYGYRQVVLGTRHASRYALLCGGIGVLTALLHAGFAATGHQQFNLPLSIATIAACLASGTGLLLKAKHSANSDE